MRLGIDFGTTHTVVAVSDRGNFPVLGFTRANGEVTETYPTVAATCGGQWRYGLAAEELAGEPGWTLLRSFKRLLTDAAAAIDRPVTVAGTTTNMGDLVAGFLSTLRRDILERSNLPLPPRPRQTIEAVIATPANARSPQRFITLDAFRRAGFEVVAVLDEPSASGIEYAHRFANAITPTRQQILVYDLGGGTFDASLVDMAGAEHTVIASAGIPRLGGDDFDELLLALVLEQLGRDAADVEPSERFTLYEACREQKERLHPNSRRIVVETESGPVQLPVDDYYTAVEPLVQRTLETTDHVLQQAGREPSALAGVYVVGGASALPPIMRALRARYGRRLHRSAYPSASAAIGLAIAYHESSPYRIRRRFARRLGVFREANAGAGVAFDQVLGEHTLQGDGQERQEVIRRYRATHNVGHFRFVEYDRVDESGSPQGDLTPVAEVHFPFDPALQRTGRLPAGLPILRLGEEGPLIEERYSIGAAGEVKLEIVSLDTGYRRCFDLGAVSPGSPTGE